MLSKYRFIHTDCHDKVEVALIEEFEEAHHQGNISGMRDCAETLLPFKVSSESAACYSIIVYSCACWLFSYWWLKDLIFSILDDHLVLIMSFKDTLWERLCDIKIWYILLSDIFFLIMNYFSTGLLSLHWFLYQTKSEGKVYYLLTGIYGFYS